MLKTTPNALQLSQLRNPATNHRLRRSARGDTNRFLAGCCYFDIALQSDPVEVWAAYTEWAASVGVHPVSIHSLAYEIRQFGADFSPSANLIRGMDVLPREAWASILVDSSISNPHRNADALAQEVAQSFLERRAEWNTYACTSASAMKEEYRDELQSNGIDASSSRFDYWYSRMTELLKDAGAYNAIRRIGGKRVRAWVGVGISGITDVSQMTVMDGPTQQWQQDQFNSFINSYYERDDSAYFEEDLYDSAYLLFRYEQSQMGLSDMWLDPALRIRLLRDSHLLYDEKIFESDTAPFPIRYRRGLRIVSPYRRFQILVMKEWGLEGFETGIASTQRPSFARLYGDMTPEQRARYLPPEVILRNGQIRLRSQSEMDTDSDTPDYFNHDMEQEIADAIDSASSESDA